MSLPLVAIIGRPNVGKSSVFNRFLRRKIAIVDDKPGITRDRNYALCDWNGREFYLIDTGGMIPETAKGIDRLVLEQAEEAVMQADLTLFVVDCQTGIDRADELIARRLQKSKRKVLLLVNKADNDNVAVERFAFYKLGLDEPCPVSANTGYGVGDALDKLVELLPHEADDKMAGDAVRIAIIGRPNVGKSSFINTLIGEERVIVSPVPGTTRDAVDTPFEYDGKKYILIDTAGLRRKTKVKEDLEFFMTLRTLRAIEGCHVAVVLVDASEGLSVQDLKVIEDAVEARRAIVLAVNKWDLVEKDTHTAGIFTEQVKTFLGVHGHIPQIFISALSGQRVAKTLTLIDTVYENWNRRIPTAELNAFVETMVAKQPPAAIRGKYINIYYATQTDVAPPTFTFFCNHPQLLQKSYLRYIDNRLRESYDFAGVPFRIKFKKR
jgi:GTP-binding protein